MEIVELSRENEQDYFLCLEDWSSDLREAGSHKENWYGKFRDRVRVKLALDDQGTVGGMIQYMPIEDSFAEGSDLYVIYCIWVHGYKKGRGNFQKRGMGKALVEAAEQDARERGAKGIAAWGIYDGLFVDGKEVRTGPPPSYEKIERLIRKRVKRLK